MALAVPKTTELLRTLTSYIDEGHAIDTWAAAVVNREIAAIEDPAARAMLNALRLGALGKEDEAVDSFDSALRVYCDPVIGLNFSTYLRRVGRYSSYVDLAYRLSELFEDPEIVSNACEAAYVTADLPRVHTFSMRLCKYVSSQTQDRVDIMSEADSFAKLLQNAERSMGVSPILVQKLASLSISVADRHRKMVSGSRVSIAEGQIMVTVDVREADPEQLSDMNYELAMAIADNDELFDIPATAWFRGKNTEAKVV